MPQDFTQALDLNTAAFHAAVHRSAQMDELSAALRSRHMREANILLAELAKGRRLRDVELADRRRHVASMRDAEIDERTIAVLEDELAGMRLAEDVKRGS